MRSESIATQRSQDAVRIGNSSMFAPMINLIRKQKNIAVVLLAVTTGILLPGFGQYTSPFMTPLVIFLVYSSLRGLAIAEVDFAAFGVPTAVALCIGYVLLPVVSAPIVGVFVSGSALVGIAITLAVPTTAGSAIVWTQFGNGDEQLAAIISISSLLLAPVMTPLVLTVLVGQGTVPIQPILVDILVIVLFGFGLKLVLPADTLSDRTANYGSGISIVLLIYSGVAGVEAGIFPLTIVVLLGLVSTIILVFGSLLSSLAGVYYNLEGRAILPIFFASGFKNLGIALLIASAYSSATVVIAIVTYYVTQQSVGAITADFVQPRLADP